VAKVDKINGVSIHTTRGVNNTRKALIATLPGNTAVTRRALMWQCKFEAGGNSRWSCYHTASGFDPNEAYGDSTSTYAPTSYWTANNVNGYNAGGMQSQIYGEDNLGNGWWGAVRSNDNLRQFMHATSSTVIEGEPSPFTDSWPYDAGASPAPQDFAKVTYGALDKVWVLGKENINTDSLCISYSDPQQINNQMTWERVANFQGGQVEPCLISNLVGRKWAAIQSPRFFLNTGSLSSSVANAADWIQVNSNIGLTVNAWAWAQRDGESSNGRFVAVGDTVGGDYGIYYSTDSGVNWTKATATARPSESPQILLDVAYDARRDIFITVGARAHILTSSDGGENWGSIETVQAAGNQTFHGVETDNFNAIITGDNAAFYISTGSLAVFNSIPTPKTSSSDIVTTADSFRSATPSVVRSGVGKSSEDVNIT
jgi:photosystem II stability/assembly factor-like uncharacterized protein